MQIHNQNADMRKSKDGLHIFPRSFLLSIVMLVSVEMVNPLGMYYSTLSANRCLATFGNMKVQGQSQWGAGGPCMPVWKVRHFSTRSRVCTKKI